MFAMESLKPGQYDDSVPVLIPGFDPIEMIRVTNG